MSKRKVCVVTGSRAEYGLLYWLMKEIQSDGALELQLIATGMHLSPEFGLTYKVIEEDGFTIDAKVEMLLSSDTPVGIAKSVGVGVIGFADALERLRPSVLVVLGDRFEVLAAVQTALVMNVPIAHISGGEITEGAIDDSIRHAISKMSNFHFVAAEVYRRRVIQMGESPNRVLNYGDPGLDNFRRLHLLSRRELEKALDFPLGSPLFLVTYHPVTVGNANNREATQALLSALDQFPTAQVIMTKPNADAGGRTISRMLEAYAQKHPCRVHLDTSMGQLRYLSAMQHCDVVIGNSSSGIVEAPAIKKPTVNIGSRQNGRLKAQSIIDCGENSEAIVGAINKALSDEFKQVICHTESLYGDCNASSRIRDFLKQVDNDKHAGKTFFDISFLLS
ncbi:MAG: UDP-N-acetylglucosamine 2-epimerase [Rhodocyclaceae bacterium]|nr:UDP-N-acetylglucosamine 2-epimerase [Rhodocyclaceae bacterium]